MEKLPDVKGVMDRYGILNRMINRNRVKMAGAGSPCTYWRNSAISKTGLTPEGLTKCYCWATPTGSGDSQQSAPDRRHFLCMGTGYLEGYQKYGYKETVLSTPSAFTKSSQNLVISGERGSAYSLTGTSLSETLTSGVITLTRFKEVDHFLANDATDADQNRVEYEYSLDGTNWTAITMVAYTGESRLANKQSSGFTLPTSTGSIQFRIRLKKRFASSPSPKWNSIRFRYRNQLTLREIDHRFAIDIPSFLAAREQQKKSIEQGEHGWTTKFPVEWWTLPEADIQNADILMFLIGGMEGYRFETKNMREVMYGSTLQILHKSFESAFLRDNKDLLGIVHYFI
jgi:hypothetical protein